MNWRMGLAFAGAYLVAMAAISAAIGLIVFAFWVLKVTPLTYSVPGILALGTIFCFFVGAWPPGRGTNFTGGR